MKNVYFLLSPLIGLITKVRLPHMTYSESRHLYAHTKYIYNIHINIFMYI